MGLGLVGAAAASVCLCASPRSVMPLMKEIGVDAARRLPWPELKTTSPIPWQNRRLKLSHRGGQQRRIEFFCTGPVTPLAYEFTRCRLTGVKSNGRDERSETIQIGERSDRIRTVLAVYK
ncbi:hypothetical protein ACLOJK_016685 [Asimina triloba]